jgi:predicted secreted protein
MTTTTAYDGRNFLIKISPDGGSTYSAVGGCQSTDVTVNNKPVDITNVLSLGQAEWLADGGEQSVSVAFSGVVANDAQLKVMQTQAFARTSVLYKMLFGTAGVIAGSFVMTNFKISGKYNDAQGFSGQLDSNGPLTLTHDT